MFYRDVNVTGAERVPADRPVIFAANHGNALADVALIIAKMPAFPHFLAAATWWKHASVRALFDFGGVVPIHRLRDGGGARRNLSAFDACNTALSAGKDLAIFPEGEMHLEPALLPLKTGAARIALGAAADAGISGVVIVPVGLVYESRGRFRSDAEVHFGEPIEIDDWTAAYRADRAKAVRVVTDLLADRLAEATVNHGSHDEARLLNRAAAFSLAGRADGAVRHPFARRNVVRRALAAALDLAGGDSSAEYRSLEAAVHEHVDDLEQLGVGGLRPGPLQAPAPRERRTLDVELGALAAPAALGLGVNAPVLAVIGLAGRRVRNEAWQATVKGVGGTLLCPVVWSAEAGVLARRIGWRRSLTVTLSGAACGMVALRWWEVFERRRALDALRRLEETQPAALARAQAGRARVRERVAALTGEAESSP
ncbi:MAG TPA: 1-acyl-sn-glycerol-3-phosphate acyltransferase [Acidimicrobiia bacterium]|nr:1-acyl-sn-glycerol-3-phosphate acyltransferase [Acidimicrobiia bacterium]